MTFLDVDYVSKRELKLKHISSINIINTREIGTDKIQDAGV